MACAIIYTVDGAGTLTAMRQAEPKSEDFMQRLVATHPSATAGTFRKQGGNSDG